MSIILVGGIDRLEKHYQKEAKERGFNIKVFTRPKKDIVRKIGKVDAIIIFTDKVAHSLKNEVLNFARAKGIPCLHNHGCGISSFRKCLECLSKHKKGGC